MATWMVADLDNIIGDFTGQLRAATQQGWHRTRPNHYRAILAALETALTERRALATVPATVAPGRPALATVEVRSTLPELTLALRWALRPFCGLIPSRSH